MKRYGFKFERPDAADASALELRYGAALLSFVGAVFTYAIFKADYGDLYGGRAVYYFEYWHRIFTKDIFLYYCHNCYRFCCVLCVFIGDRARRVL